MIYLIAIFVLIGAVFLCANKRKDSGAGKRNIARIKFIQAEYGDDER